MNPVAPKSYISCLDKCVWVDDLNMVQFCPSFKDKKRLPGYEAPCFYSNLANLVISTSYRIWRGSSTPKIAVRTMRFFKSELLHTFTKIHPDGVGDGRVKSILRRSDDDISKRVCTPHYLKHRCRRPRLC